MINIFPAIDIQLGQSVRLVKGERNSGTIFHVNPLDVAKSFVEDGASNLHIVNLDGAFDGSLQNFSIISEILKEYSESISIQVGGGIRSLDIAKSLFSFGTKRIILSTVALENKELFKTLCEEFGSENIIISVDEKDGYVTSHGWEKTHDIRTEEFIDYLVSSGIKIIVYTDISKDGMMQGPNLSRIDEIMKLDKISMIASGGFAQLKDVEDVINLNSNRLHGIILGRSLYEKTISLKDVLNQKFDNF